MDRRFRVSLALLLATVSGCRDEEASSDSPSTGATEPESKDEEKSPPPAAPEESSEPPAPTPGVVLTQPGKSPSDVLDYTPESCRAKDLVVTLRVGSSDDGERIAPSPRVRLKLMTAFEEEQDPQLERSNFRVQSLDVVDERRVDDEAEDGLETALSSLVDRDGIYERDLLGSTRTMVLTGALAADPTRARLASALRHAWTHSTIALPDQPVGKGAEWTVTRRVNLHGIDTWEIATYRLTEIELPQIEVEGEVVYRLGDGEHRPVGWDDVAQVTSLDASGTYQARLDLSQAAPIEAHASVSANFGGLDQSGKAIQGRFNLDAAVDENWIAGDDPRIEISGKFTQGSLVYGKVAPDTKVWFRKRRVRVSDAGDFLIAFEHDAPSRALLSFAFPDGPIERHVVQVEPREFTEERIDGLPTEMVDPDGETRKAMAKAHKRIKKIRARASRKTYFTKGFQMPARGRISSTYGRPRILNGEKKDRHWGLDIAAPVGAKVKAPAGGIVVFVQEDVPLAGNFLIVDHGFGLTSSFLHLADIKVKEGAEVEAGQVIATVGNTGRTTGPHLDWRMNLLETRIDPQLLLDW